MQEGLGERRLADERRVQRSGVGARRGGDGVLYGYANFFLTFGYLLANVERPVLGCVDADVCKTNASKYSF